MPDQPKVNGSKFDDVDPTETREWLESIDSVLKASGPERAHFLLERAF
jgi:pyruvate dehydrogenase E1 component